MKIETYYVIQAQNIKGEWFDLARWQTHAAAQFGMSSRAVRRCSIHAPCRIAKVTAKLTYEIVE